MFKGTKPSQDLSVTKSFFECSIWILSVMHTASYFLFFLQLEKTEILMLMQVCFLPVSYTHLTLPTRRTV